MYIKRTDSTGMVLYFASRISWLLV